jgi:hypothetical protein
MPSLQKPFNSGEEHSGHAIVGRIMIIGIAFHQLENKSLYL